MLTEPQPYESYSTDERGNACPVKIITLWSVYLFFSNEKKIEKQKLPFPLPTCDTVSVKISAILSLFISFLFYFFYISISSSSHNVPSPVLLWLDRTWTCFILASETHSRITNAPGLRINLTCPFYLYLPTFLIFPDGSSLLYFPLLVYFSGSQFSYISSTFFPILVITACFWHCAACSLLLCCASSSSVSGRWTEKWMRERNTQAHFRCPGKKPSCLCLES